jgi:polyisoprenoid-binding protein YceI
VSTTIQSKTALPTGTWEIDPVHSRVEFAVPYMIGTFRGSFAPVEGALAAGDDTATLTGTAKVAGVQVQDENLQGHLLSPDFFDAERHPEITFSAEHVERSGDELVVDGTLTIKGITQDVELTGTITDPVTDAYDRDRIGLTLSTTVDRTSFGLNWNVPLPSGEPALGNDVTLTAELFLSRAA